MAKLFLTVGLLFVTVFADVSHTMDLCEVVKGASKLEGKEVRVDAVLLLSRHGPMLLSAREGDACRVFPILPGTPKDFSPGLNREGDVASQQMKDLYEAGTRYPYHNGAGVAVEVEGQIKVARASAFLRTKPRLFGGGKGTGIAIWVTAMRRKM